MSKGQVLGLAVLAIGAGFAFGFLYGGAVRDATPGATDASFADGALTVKVRVSDALRQGISSLLG